MRESSSSKAQPAVEIEQIRRVLVRVVASVCPPWLAADRDDIVQNACMRLLKISSEPEQSREFSASYLWRTAHSAVMDEIRRRLRQHSVPEEEAADVPSPEGTPESGRADHEIGEAIVEALGQLGESRRRAVALHLFGYRLDESARMLGWDAKRLANMRYRGLEELRELLKRRGLEP